MACIGNRNNACCALAGLIRESGLSQGHIWLKSCPLKMYDADLLTGSALCVAGPAQKHR